MCLDFWVYLLIQSSNAVAFMMLTNKGFFILCNLRFRHQHEQLRQVIVRVLRPARSAQADKTKDTPAESNDLSNINGVVVSESGGKILPKAVGKEQPLLDASDANAIEEVNLAYEIVKEIDCLDVTKEGSEVWEAAVKR